MLKQVSLFLAAHDNVVSVIARTSPDLKTLEAEAEQSGGKINSLSLDYRDHDSLKQNLEQSIEINGPVTLVVNWMHSDALDASQVIAEVLNRTSPVCRYFQVLPTNPSDNRRGRTFFEDPFANFERVLYRKIILGYQEEKELSRWLTHQEISEGIIDALRNDRKDAVIGIWDAGQQRTQQSA